MNTIIEKIRAEVERRMNICNGIYERDKEKNWDMSNYYHGKAVSLGELLSFLDTLKEQPVDFPTTDEEMKEFLATHPKVEVPERYKNPDWVFEQPVCEELEEEIKRYYEDMDGDCRYAQTARHFAKWQKQHDAELIEIAYNDGITIGMTKQKEQMMKEAVEVRVGFNAGLPMLKLRKKDWKVGDKVKLIIIKEDQI